MHQAILAALPAATGLRLAAAGLAAMLGSALLVRWMIRLAVMDVPGARSAHDRPVPRGGGVGMVGAVLLGVPVCLALLPGARLLPASLALFATALLALVSWLDDLRQFGPRAKFAAQCAAAALMVAASVAAAPALPGGIVLAGLCGTGFCWLLLTTNALNFIDGLNGLASGVTAICGLFTLALALSRADAVLAALALMLACGLAGFLPFNMPRARIFMGDVGSQVCGLLGGGLALLLLAGTGSLALALTVPLILSAILWDVVFTLARRLAAGDRLTQAHRGHLYQVMARAGLTPLAVALIHWGFALWGGAVAVVLLPGRPVAAILLVLAPQLPWTAIAVRAGRRCAWR